MEPVPVAAARARTPVRAWRAASGSLVQPTGFALMGLVAVLVAGILGMHALGGHGTPAAANAVVARTSPDPHAAHEHGAAASVPAISSGSAHEGADRSGHGLGGMVVLCAVMLAAALGLLALLVVPLVRRVRFVRLARLAARIQPVRWVRGTGPPPAWQFSVIRC
jgi:hypothetical protein